MPPTTTHSQPLRSTADRFLRRDKGITLDGFVLPLRADNVGWRRIAAMLLLQTDGVIDVTGEAIRLWYGNLPADQAAQQLAA